MTFEEWKVKHDDEIINVATVFFNYERGVNTKTCYDELEWLLRKAFISGQNHCNCVHTDNSKVIDYLDNQLTNAKEIVKDLLSLKASVSSAEDVRKRFSVRERAVEFLKENEE